MLYVTQHSIHFAHMASHIANVNVHCFGGQNATPRIRVGYQLVGRTLPIWNTFGRVGPFTPQAPWLLHYFDQVPPPSALGLLSMQRITEVALVLVHVCNRPDANSTCVNSIQLISTLSGGQEMKACRHCGPSIDPC